jgi:hypothetical protein
LAVTRLGSPSDTICGAIPMLPGEGAGHNTRGRVCSPHSGIVTVQMFESLWLREVNRL